MKDGLDYNNIRTINQDKDGNILIGGTGWIINFMMEKNSKLLIL